MHNASDNSLTKNIGQTFGLQTTNKEISKLNILGQRYVIPDKVTSAFINIGVGTGQYFYGCVFAGLEGFSPLQTCLGILFSAIKMDGHCSVEIM